MKTLSILLTIVAWVSLTQEVLSYTIKSSLSTAQHEHDVYDGNGKNAKHNSVVAHTGAILSPVVMTIPNIQVKTAKPSSSVNSKVQTKKVVVMQSANKVVSPTKISSSSNGQNARNAANMGAPIMQMNHKAPKKQSKPTPNNNIQKQPPPTPPPQQPSPTPPPQQPSPNPPPQQPSPTPPQQTPAISAVSVQQKPKNVPSAIVTELSGQQYTQSAKQQPTFYNIPQGKHSLSNPVSLKMQSASTSVVVPEEYIKDYYKSEPIQISHPILPIKDNLSNVVSITIRSAPHSARKLQRHKKVVKKVVKPVIHKKPKIVKPHVDIKAPVMVEPKPKRHPKRKHKKHSVVSVEYIHVLPSKPFMSDSSLSATHSYAHQKSLINNALKPAIHKKHKIVKPKKKHIKHKPQVDIKAPVMVEPKPKKHPKRKHKKHSAVSVKYIHVLPSKPLISDSSLSATHSYSHQSLIHKVVTTLKKTIAGVLPTKGDNLKLDHHSMFSY